MRGDMGLATLIIFVVIILMATVAAIILLQATNAVKTQAVQTQEESQSKFKKRLIFDRITLVVDLNNQSPYYRKARYVWIYARLPMGGAPVDLRKAFLSFKTGNEYAVAAKYIDADGDDIFGENACEQDSPYPIEQGGDVDYNALTKGDAFTAVWIQCDGKNEDYIVYPGQVIMLVYMPKDGVPEGTKFKITFSIADGGITEVETYSPTVYDEQYEDVPI